MTKMVIGVIYKGDCVWYADVEPRDSVWKLKRLLRDTDGIGLPTPVQRLKRGGSLSPTVGATSADVSFPLEDELTLAHYGVRDRMILFLSVSPTVPHCEIDVEWVAGRVADVISLRVAPGDAVGSIKRLIEESRGIPIERQHLSFEDAPLEDDDTKLQEVFGLFSRSTLDLCVD